MTKDEQLRGAIDRRLSGLDASAARRERIRARIAQRAEPVMKRKVTAGVMLAIVAVLAVSGVAVSAGINLFARMADQNEALGHMAEQATVTDNPTLVYEHEKLGRVEGAITNAYYDGQKLQVGYYLSDTMYSEPWLPTDSELATMTMQDENPYAVTMEMIEKGLLKQEDMTAADMLMAEAISQGRPWGCKSYCVFYRELRANGVEVAYEKNWYDILKEEDVQLYEVTEYVQPLPEAVQNQEQLRLTLPIFESEVWEYFDGKNWYSYRESKDIGSLTATVDLAAAE